MRVLFARVSISSVWVLAWALAVALMPSAGYSQTASSADSDPKVQQRLQEVEAMKKDLLRKMQDLDNRIHTLEAEAKRQKSKIAKIPAKPAAPPQPPLPPLQTVVAAIPLLDTTGKMDETSGPALSTTQASAPAVKIFGAVKLDVYYNTRRPQAPGIPFYLVPTIPNGFSQNTFDMNARQSMLGVSFTGPMIGSFHSGGKISAVFFDNTILADRYGFLLQQAYGELYNDHWRFAAGLQLDVFAPGLPTVLPFSGLGGSGSAGNTIKGQLRVERFLAVGSDSQLTLQMAVSEPLGTVELPDTSLDEDNGKPNVEGRIALGLGKPAPIGIGLLTQRPLEIGVSGVAGQLRRTSIPPDAPRRVVSNVQGVALDFRVNLLDGCFGFKGEVYSGQALGAYNGGILQSLDAVTWKAIRTTGGWLEGFVYLRPNLHSHTGIAIDDPNDNDITAIPFTQFGRTYNRTLWTNLIWDVTKYHRIAFEVTRRETEYKEPTNLPNKDFGFQTQFQWTF
jgi:hypothetical protein